MTWPWEQFNWGVFWAVTAVLMIRGFFRLIGAISLVQISSAVVSAGGEKEG